MGKIWVEVCLVSARGLRRTSSLFKLQWFAVGWIDPNNKYCTGIDASGNASPVWKTKFSALVDNSESNVQDLALNVEVYSREPIFLREKLQGTATVVLKELIDKYKKNSEVSKPIEEVGSFQLMRRNSSKPQGFVDVSIRIFVEREEPSSSSGNEGEIMVMNNSNGSNLAIEFENGSSQALLHQPDPKNSPYAHPVPSPTNYSNQSGGGPSYPTEGGAAYQPPRTPPPPPPPSNVGYISTFLPRTDHLPSSSINMSSSGAPPGHGGGPGFRMGMSAGALAAGAVIFGDDFMLEFEFPGGLQDAS
ncbi:hypothetical protein F0562_031466 [Nyssa sinensis]|uniref:C2 domain-containing protein n=1 Tax=Nyssa sinensis TaxID=561372 RepID=A0A5J5AU84_9ASTE|nr:hypothetical protein F0562_031466 [Nyssa sinensis]